MRQSLKKFERLLALIYFLKLRHRASAREIQAHLGMSERTLYRDLNALNDIFGEYVQIVCTPEGYCLDTKIYAPPLHFIPDELAALQTAVACLESNNPHYQLARQALSKLESQSGTFLNLTELENRLSVMQPSAKDRVPLKRLQEIEEALQSKRKLDIDYFSFHSRAVKTYRFGPYSLLFRKQAWYLLGHDFERGKDLLLRAFRIRGIRILESEHTIPAGFNLRDYFREHWEVFDGKPEEVHLQFEDPTAWLIEEMEWHPSQKTERDAEGLLNLFLKVPLSPEFTTWVLGWGSNCRVVAPAKLRIEVRKHVQKMVKACETEPQATGSLSV